MGSWSQGRHLGGPTALPHHGMHRGISVGLGEMARARGYSVNIDTEGLRSGWPRSCSYKQLQIACIIDSTSDESQCTMVEIWSCPFTYLSHNTPFVKE